MVVTLRISSLQLEKKDGPVVRALAWDLGDPGSITISATDFLCDMGQIM